MPEATAGDGIGGAVGPRPVAEGVASLAAAVLRRGVEAGSDRRLGRTETPEGRRWDALPAFAVSAAAHRGGCCAGLAARRAACESAGRAASRWPPWRARQAAASVGCLVGSPWLMAQVRVCRRRRARQAQCDGLLKFMIVRTRVRSGRPGPAARGGARKALCRRRRCHGGWSGLRSNCRTQRPVTARDAAAAAAAKRAGAPARGVREYRRRTDRGPAVAAGLSVLSTRQNVP